MDGGTSVPSQAQIAFLQELMASQRHVEEVNTTNEKLNQSLAARSETLRRLNQLSIACASLLPSIDSSSPKRDPSSLQVLSRLSYSEAIAPVDEESEPDLSKTVIGEFLNQLMTLIVQGVRNEKGTLGLLTLVNLEMAMNELLMAAEKKEFIPKTDAKGSWRRKVVEHQPIYEQIVRIVRGGGDRDDQADDDDDDAE
jgi:hypothetical protein